MILLSIPTLIYSIFVITKCINSYILLTANLGDFKMMARKIIESNVAEIFNKLISLSNRNSDIEDVSNDSDDYLNDFVVNFRRSSKTGNTETEEVDDKDIIKEANRYVIEQLGKHIKERVIDDLVSKFLRNKFNIGRTENTQKDPIKNKIPDTRYNKYDDIKNSQETSREIQQNKRWTGKNYAKNFNNEANDILLKRKVPENKPTLNPNELKRPRYTIKNSLRNKQTKGNEIFVILQPKVETTVNKKEKEVRVKKPTTTKKLRFIEKTRKEHATTNRNKPKVTSRKKPTTLDLIYEKIKLNTNYTNSFEYSEKDEIIKDTKDKRIKSNQKNVKDKRFNKETDVVKAVTSYLWVDGEEDDLDEKLNEKSPELSAIKSKKTRIQTTPYNFIIPAIDKYDFTEPIPEKDRVREVIPTIRKPPSRINKKQKAKYLK